MPAVLKTGWNNIQFEEILILVLFFWETWAGLLFTALWASLREYSVKVRFTSKVSLANKIIIRLGAGSRVIS